MFERKAFPDLINITALVTFRASHAQEDIANLLHLILQVLLLLALCKTAALLSQFPLH